MLLPLPCPLGRWEGSFNRAVPAGGEGSKAAPHCLQQNRPARSCTLARARLTSTGGSVALAQPRAGLGPMWSATSGGAASLSSPQASSQVLELRQHPPIYLTPHIYLDQGALAPGSRPRDGAARSPRQALWHYHVALPQARLQFPAGPARGVAPANRRRRSFAERHLLGVVVRGRGGTGGRTASPSMPRTCGSQ